MLQELFLKYIYFELSPGLCDFLQSFYWFVELRWWEAARATIFGLSTTFPPQL